MPFFGGEKHVPKKYTFFGKNMGDCAMDRPIVDVGERRCILKLDQKSKKTSKYLGFWATSGGDGSRRVGVKKNYLSFPPGGN